MNERISTLVFDAIAEINKTLPEKDRIKNSLDSFLMAPSGPLDSLSLISLVVSIEQKIQKELHVSISLASETAMAQKKSPFLTVGSLTDYVLTLISKR